MIRALIWDVDGTLAETEETHREAFNEAFAGAGLDWVWDRPTYRRLLQVTGGKERMAHFATLVDYAISALDIRKLHAAKTEIYTRMVETGSVPLRPGVVALIRAARQQGIRNAIATTTSLPNVRALIQSSLGQPAEEVFSVIAAGDEVSAKKPAPDVYLLALQRLGMEPSKCIAVEDSVPGVAAARAAGLRVLVTPSTYTDGDDFTGADWTVPDLTAPLPGPLAALYARA